MCLFRNKGIFGIKLSIIEKGILEEFWRSANSPTLRKYCSADILQNDCNNPTIQGSLFNYTIVQR